MFPLKVLAVWFILLEQIIILRAFIMKILEEKAEAIGGRGRGWFFEMFYVYRFAPNESDEYYVTKESTQTYGT